MSDAQNLNDFFAQQSKRKGKKGKAPAKAKPTAAAQATAEEEQPTAAAATTQPEPQPAAAQDFADSSDDESNQIVINEAQKKIVDRKELEANKKNKDEEEGNSGWGLGTMLGAEPEVQAASGSFQTSAAKGPQTGGLKMAFGKPTFTRKQKGIMDQQDFPDLADASSPGTGDAQRSKADGAMMFGGGATAKGARAEAAGGAAEETKSAATKPVFRGKAKLNTGGATNTEMGTASMSYDFSKMRMSAATTKKAEGAAGEGGARGGGARRGAPSFEDDDDFEVVAEKKKERPRRQYEEPSFGGGKPMFTRGGGNREQ